MWCPSSKVSCLASYYSKGTLLPLMLINNTTYSLDNHFSFKINDPSEMVDGWYGINLASQRKVAVILHGLNER